MRIIEVFGEAIRAVAVSPDGRFVAAGGDAAFGVFDWATGERAFAHPPFNNRSTQLAFTPDGKWVLRGCAPSGPTLISLDPGHYTWTAGTGYAGGVAVSPDGKLLVAVQEDGQGPARLHRWALPARRAEFGFEGWAPFRRLAFSPNGDYLAGIRPGTHRTRRPDPAEFEIRFARSGGRDFHYPPMGGPVFDSLGFISFARDSGTCAFGWEGEFHVLDTSTGTTRYLRRVETPFRDAGFTGSGRHFATVEDSGRLKLWDARAWQVAREYDWECGPLTCVAFTADGSAGVCGTADGRLVQFDVDE